MMGKGHLEVSFFSYSFLVIHDTRFTCRIIHIFCEFPFSPPLFILLQHLLYHFPLLLQLVSPDQSRAPRRHNTKNPSSSTCPHLLSSGKYPHHSRFI